jgi:O-methyltransferase
MENYEFSPRRRLRKKVRQFIEGLPYSRTAQIAATLPKLSKWRRDRGSQTLVSGRRELHIAVSKLVADRTILYLEFGVYRGDSIKYWTMLNRRPDSKFVGFDTFTGLPEAWETNLTVVPANVFTTEGKVPQIDDDRCSFRVGLFQETLRPFLSQLDRAECEQMVVHMDADIYTSTLYVLTQCDPVIRAGDILIFDEFSSVLNEFRALEDWSGAYLRKYTPIFSTPYSDQVAIRIE